MRTFSMAMVFLMLFSITLPGVAFADERQTSEEVEQVAEEAVVNQVEVVEENQPETEQESLPEAAEAIDSENDPEVHPIEEEAEAIEEVDSTDDENGEPVDSAEDEEMVHQSMEELNEALSLEVDVVVEKRTASVTAKANNATEYELTGGSFTFHLEGDQAKVDQNGDEAVAVYKKLDDGRYKVSVKYEATVTIDGETHPVSNEHTVSFQVGEDPVEVAIGAWHYYQGDENILELHAYLEDADRGKGTWTFEVDGKKETVKTREPYADAWFELSNPKQGEHYEAVITFEGKADGKKAKGSTEYSFKLVVPTLDYSCTNKGLALTTHLEGADSARGEWFFGLFSWEQEDWAGEHETGWVDGTSYRYTFDKVNPGNYDLYVDYFGEVDGEDFWTWFYDEIEIESGDPCAAGAVGPKPGTGQPGDGQKPDDGKTVTPEQPKPITGEVKQGASMPKTATEYPLGMLIGAVVVLLGAGLYLIRRRTVLQ